MNKTIVAIDPGKSGGIAWWAPECATHCIKMPAITRDIVDVLDSADFYFDAENPTEGVCVYIEQVGGYIKPRKGKDGKDAKVPGANSPMFNFGKNYGRLEGITEALYYELVYVTPQKWIKALGLGKKGKRTPTEWKNHLKAMAQRLYPSIKVTHAVQDALLILWWARMVNNGHD